MLYRLDPQANTGKFYTEPRSGNKLPYCTAKEMRKRYPDRNFVIVAEIGGFARPPDQGDKLLADDGRQIPVSPRGNFTRPFEWVSGYIAVEKNTYIAAIGSVFHIFIKHRV